MELREFVKNNTSKIKKYKKYLSETDWTLIGNNLHTIKDPKPGMEKIYENIFKEKVEEYRLQEKVVKTVLDRLKYLISTYKSNRSDSPYRTFLKLTKSVVDYHITRCNEYENSVDILDIPNQEQRSREVEFQNIIFKSTSEILEGLSKLNLSMDDGGDIIEFYNDMKAPLLMHDILVGMYPDISKKLKAMKIDFDSEPEPYLFNQIENPPVWDLKKHYFEQNKTTLQFYVDEWKKLKNGVVIDGVYFSPWMYYHINFFTTKYPDVQLNEKTGDLEAIDRIGVPPLRDNEWWVINDNYEKAKKEGKMMFLAATRRAAKTTMITSHLGSCVVQNKLNLVVAGGSEKDLGQIETNFTLLQQNIHPAFRVPILVNDWEKFVDMGLKTKLNKSIKCSILKVVNMDGGSSSKSEIFAGFTPDAVIIDEIMKLPFKHQLLALKPAIDMPHGKRCVVILSGTAGNSDLAKDAFDTLREPDLYDILSMPWDTLNKRVPEEARTWQERPFGTFIPAQMSSKDGMVKVDTNLSEFLKIKGDYLSKIKIKVTDWTEAKRIIEEDRKRLKKDLVAYTNEVLYFPMCPSDMLISTKQNPFPVQEAISHREYLKAKGGEGIKCFLTQKLTGEIDIELSNNPLPEYPFKGGFIDSPVVLYEPLPKDKPPNYLYISGLDDYKQDESGTDSVGSFHIYKVDVGLDKFCGKIVASYAARPDPHDKLYQQMYLLQQAFNAVCFMENADMGYKDFLERRRVADKWLAPSLDFEADLAKQSEGRRKYGWAPTPKNKKILLSKLRHYCEQLFEIEGENGEEMTVLGVQTIDDIGLLDEIIAYDESKNVDRITSFMSALAYHDYLFANYMLYNPNIQIRERREETKKKIKQSNPTPFFRSGSGKFF